MTSVPLSQAGSYFDDPLPSSLTFDKFNKSAFGCTRFVHMSTPAKSTSSLSEVATPDTDTTPVTCYARGL